MTIEQLHDRLFEVMCVIDDACKKENVRYFLDSGTEIGAAREKDFIAWDDDIDLKVLAEDYPAFKAAMERHLPAYMQLVEPDVFTPGFYDFVVRVIDTRYLLRKETEVDRFYGNYQNRVGADILIFSKVPESKFAKSWMMLSTKILYGLGMAHRHSVDIGKYSTVQKLQVLILSKVGKLFPSEQIHAMFRANIARYANKKSAYRFTACSRMECLRFHPEHIYTTTTTLPIRGREFPVPGGFDEELRQQYGDYMQPPKNRDFYIKHLAEE